MGGGEQNVIYHFQIYFFLFLLVHFFLHIQYKKKEFFFLWIVYFLKFIKRGIVGHCCFCCCSCCCCGRAHVKCLDPVYVCVCIYVGMYVCMCIYSYVSVHFQSWFYLFNYHKEYICTVKNIVIVIQMLIIKFKFM